MVIKRGKYKIYPTLNVRLSFCVWVLENDVYTKHFSFNFGLLKFWLEKELSDLIFTHTKGQRSRPRNDTKIYERVTRHSLETRNSLLFFKYDNRPIRRTKRKVQHLLWKTGILGLRFSASMPPFSLFRICTLRWSWMVHIQSVGCTSLPWRSFIGLAPGFQVVCVPVPHTYIRLCTYVCCVEFPTESVQNHHCRTDSDPESLKY